jgi:hypothetical protein
MLSNDIYFPNQDNFNFLLIKPKDISQIRFDNPEYKKIICNLDIYQEINTSADDFFENLNKFLELDYFRNKNQAFSLHTELVWTTSEHIYELIYIVLPPAYNPLSLYNGVANIVKKDHQHIFGNVVIIKTQVPHDTISVNMVDCSVNDLHNLLENRVRHIGIKIEIL